MDARSRHRVNAAEPVVQFRTADPVTFAPELLTHPDISGRRIAESFSERLQIESGSANDEHPFAALQNLIDDGCGGLAVLADAERLGGLNAIDEVVLDLGALPVGGRLRKDAHLAVDLHRVAGDDPRPKRLG